MLRQRIEVSQHAIGIVVGLADPAGSRVVAVGRARQGSDEPVTGESVFEVGSVTKVFTSLLLAQMVESGEVRLDDPVARYLPRSVRAQYLKEITLLHLSRHTAGFPLFPDNLRPVDPENPRDVYTNEALYKFLNRYRPTRKAGTFQLYSNVGPALLGELLARRAGTEFETALRSRVLDPLGMRRTGIRLTPELHAAHALGHANLDRPLPLGDVRGMPGAGSLRSTGSDMVRFLEASLGLRESSLAAALSMGLGWFPTKILGTELLAHGGATDGFTAYVGLDLERRRGVVLLSNNDYEGQKNIAIHLLVPSLPLFQPDPPGK